MERSQIVIKPGKEAVTQAFILFLFLLLLSVLLMLLLLDDSIIASILIFLIAFIAAVWNLISQTRTITFTAEGITISFLFIHQTIEWESIKTKQIISYTGLKTRSWGRSDSCRFQRGAIFYAKRLKRPLRIYPSEYCQMYHPWSFIYVDFKEWEDHKKVRSINPETYVINGSSFVKQVKDWNVDLEWMM